MSFLQRVVNQAHAVRESVPVARPKGFVPGMPEVAAADPMAPESAGPAPFPDRLPAEPAAPATARLGQPIDRPVEPAAPPVDEVSTDTMTVLSDEPATMPLPTEDTGLPSDPPPAPQIPAPTTDSAPGAEATPANSSAPPLPPPVQAFLPPTEPSGKVDTPPSLEGAPEIPAPVEAKAPSAPEQRLGATGTILSDIVAAVAEPHPLPPAETAAESEPPDKKPAPTAQPRPEMAAEKAKESPPTQPVEAPPLAQPLPSPQSMRQETGWQRPPEPPPASIQPQLQIDQIDVVVSEPQPRPPTATARPSALAAVSASRRYLRRL